MSDLDCLEALRAAAAESILRTEASDEYVKALHDADLIARCRDAEAKLYAIQVRAESLGRFRNEGLVTDKEAFAVLSENVRHTVRRAILDSKGEPTT